MEKQRDTVGGYDLRDVVDQALGHRQGALADIERQQQLALRVHRHPDPLGRPLQAFNGLSRIHVTISYCTEQGIEFIELHLGDAHVTQKFCEKALRWSATSSNQASTVLGSTANTGPRRGCPGFRQAPTAHTSRSGATRLPWNGVPCVSEHATGKGGNWRQVPWLAVGLDCPSPSSPDSHSWHWGRNAARCPPGVGVPGGR